MKKILSLLLVLTLLAALMAGCGTKTVTTTPTPAPEVSEAPEETPAEPEEDVTIRLGGLKGPTTIGMVKLLADAEAGETVNNYEYTLAGSADELTPKLIQGELDIIAGPVNLASILWNNTDGAVQFAAINTLGVVYIVEKGGEQITSMADLSGMTIYATGKGSVPEYALRYLLAQSGLDPENDVTIEWKSEPTEVVALMQAQEHVVAMLPQPFVTVAQSQVEGLRVAINMTEAWNELDNGSMLVTAGLIVRTAFAEEHPEALEAFLQEYAASTAYVNENVADAAVLVEQVGIVKAAVAGKAIPFCNITYIDGESMKEIMQNYLVILHELNPQAVGGELPDDTFYYGA
ncbi:MAG: ABC transporter substrate-binding protein [Eubacteriales bacterium]|nr:ABC transporter substrate-binding protein [Eubacteriales bacterium]